MTDSLHKLWFPQAFIEEEDPELVKAIDEIEAEERALDED